MNLAMNDAYPVLFSTERLVKMADCCALINRHSGGYVLLEPISAVILALCNGSLNVKKIINIVNNSLFPEETYEYAEKLVYNTLEKASGFFEIYDEMKIMDWKYNPTDFVYIAEKRQKDILLPLEKPLQMTFVLTNACNFECIYCFRSSKSKWKNELNCEEIYDLIDQAAEMGLKYCSLTGGEPTLHPHFEEIVKRFLEKDIYVYVSTNGSLITKKMLVNLKNAGLETIQFSLDVADEKIFDYMVGKKNCYTKAIESIKLAKKLGYIVRIKGVLTDYNAKSIDELYNTCVNIGVDSVYVEQFSPGLDGRGNKELIVSEESLEYAEKISKDYSVKYKGKTDIIPFKRTKKWCGPEDIVYCGGLYTSFIVQPDGTVGACEQANHNKLTFGNIRNKKLSEIWKSPEVIDFLNPSRFLVNEPCKSCEEFSKCRSGCANYTLQFSENLYDPDPRCWKVQLGNNNPLKLG